MDKSHRINAFADLKPGSRTGTDHLRRSSDDDGSKRRTIFSVSEPAKYRQKYR
jgi:hypothetical protein